MLGRDDVEKYIKELHVKIKTFGILYRDDRGKNAQTLLDLEISPGKRTEIIESLKLEDYSEGPIDEKLHGMMPMWVFGKLVREKEVYIKITMGNPNLSAVCISFHIAEHPMNYPFKKGKS